MPSKRKSTTDRPLGTQAARVARYFARNPNAKLESNRSIAAKVRVDEWTVRKWKAEHGVPALTPGTGAVPEPERPTRKRSAKK